MNGRPKNTMTENSVEKPITGPRYGRKTATRPRVRDDFLIIYVRSPKPSLRVTRSDVEHRIENKQTSKTKIEYGRRTVFASRRHWTNGWTGGGVTLWNARLPTIKYTKTVPAKTRFPARSFQPRQLPLIFIGASSKRRPLVFDTMIIVRG